MALLLPRREKSRLRLRLNSSLENLKWTSWKRQRPRTKKSSSNKSRPKKRRLRKKPRKRRLRKKRARLFKRSLLKRNKLNRSKNRDKDPLLLAHLRSLTSSGTSRDSLNLRTKLRELRPISL